MSHSKKLRCEDCAWYDIGLGICDNAYASQGESLNIPANAEECGEYRKRTEFEDWLSDIIRNFEERELDELTDGNLLSSKTHKEVKETVKKILWRYQEMLDSEEGQIISKIGVGV